MIRRNFLATAIVVLPLLSGGAFAQDDKAKKQAEIRTAAKDSLERFYKAEPKIKADVAKAPGYAVFRSFGFSFVLGGAGGKGLVHDAKTGKDTFMEMAQGSVGLQMGAAEYETLIVFKTAQAMNQFVEKGWEVAGGGGASAGVAGKSAGGSSGEQMLNDANYYMLTKNGLHAGGAAAGTKFWKDKDLN